jgi:amidohydrolase
VITKTHERIVTAVDELAEALTGLSLDLHARPELAMQEEYAAARICGLLEDEGFQVERGVARLPTAFRATWGSGRPAIAYLCEYDALPGIGHGCGHNLIASGGAGAAIALRRALPDPPGTIACIGTPGEEGAGGKIIELEAGVFDDIDAALMFHPGDRNWPWRHATAAIPLEIEYTGVAAHAAMAHEGRSALAAVIQLFVALDAMRQFMPETARIHGIITDGGQAVNVVPAHAAAKFQVRALTSEGALELLDRVEESARAAASATGTTVTMRRGLIYAERKNNHTIASRTAAYLSSFGVEVEDPVLRGGTGSSDIGNVSLRLPAIHPYLKVAPRGTPGHSVEMAAIAGGPDAQQAMLAMAKALACTGADLLADGSLLAAAREEFATAGPDLPD